MLGYKLALPSSAMNTYWLRLYEEKIFFLLVRCGTIKTRAPHRWESRPQDPGGVEVGSLRRSSFVVAVLLQSRRSGRQPRRPSERCGGAFLGSIFGRIDIRILRNWRSESRRLAHRFVVVHRRRVRQRSGLRNWPVIFQR
jgi:hypothetical protein